MTGLVQGFRMCKSWICFLETLNSIWLDRFYSHVHRHNWSLGLLAISTTLVDIISDWTWSTGFTQVDQVSCPQNALMESNFISMQLMRCRPHRGFAQPRFYFSEWWIMGYKHWTLLFLNEESCCLGCDICSIPALVYTRENWTVSSVNW